MNAEAVDILPTIADALRHRGAVADRRHVAARSGATGAGLEGDVLGRRDGDTSSPRTAPTWRRRFGASWISSATAPATRTAPRACLAFDELLGQPLAALRVVEGGGPVEIASAWDYENVDLAAPAVVFDVAGRFASPRPDTFVAVAVNGVVEAVTRTWESNARGWLATPRLDAWRQGRNAIEVFVIDRDEAGLLLRRAALGPVRPVGLNLISAAAADDWGVSQGGFYPMEGAAGGDQFRWTREQAELSNLFTHDPPREVQIDVLHGAGWHAESH